jgi:Zn-dependent protease
MPQYEPHSRPAGSRRLAHLRPGSMRPGTPGSGGLGLGSLRLGRFLGFPVRLSPSWLVLAALVTVGYGIQADRARPGLSAAAAFALGAGFVLCLLVSVLLHELGHAIASRRLGTGVRGITLELLGGYTEMERDAPRPRVEATVSLAGPAVSFALAVATGVAAAAVPRGTPLAQFLAQVALSNAIIAVFNVLPGLPLDGGRALHALIWAVTGDRHRGRRVAGYTGLGLAFVVAVAAGGLWLVGWLLPIGAVFGLVVAWSIATGGASAVRLGRAGARLHLLAVDRLARPIFGVPAGTTVGEAYRMAASGRAGPVAGEVVFGVVDPDGRLWAVVPEGEDTTVPPERREVVALDTVARLVDAYRSVPAGLTGDDVLRAVEADPVGDYLVTSGEDVVGILRVADVARVLDPDTSASARSFDHEGAVRD